MGSKDLMPVFAIPALVWTLLGSVVLLGLGVYFLKYTLYVDKPAMIGSGVLPAPVPGTATDPSGGFTLPGVGTLGSGALLIGVGAIVLLFLLED
jgi:hypothetical protein